MKKLLMVAVAALAVASLPATSGNVPGSYDAGGCNASQSWSCPQPAPKDEGLGGAGG